MNERVKHLVLLVVSLLVAACSIDGPVGPQDPTPTVTNDKPFFNHVPGTGTPVVEVDIGKYLLTVRPDVLGPASYQAPLGATTVLFGGGLAYGVSDTQFFSYNPNGFPSSGFTSSGFPIGVDNLLADSHTSTLLIEMVIDDVRVGASSPLGVGVVRETFAFSDIALDDFVFIKYTLTNNSEVPIDNLIVGEAMDHDLGQVIVDNFVEWDDDLEVAKITSPSSPVVVGHTLLDLSVQNYDGMGSGFDTPCPDWNTYEEAWHNFTSGILCDLLLGPTDVRHMASAPAGVSIAPGASFVFWTVLVAGADETEFAANLQNARTQFASLPQVLSAPSIAIEVGVAAVGVLNPDTPGTFDVEYTFPEATQANQVDQVVYFGTPAIATSVSGNIVTATFDKEEFLSRDSQYDPLMNEEQVIGAGRLADGTYFYGVDHPSIERTLLVAPVTQLTFHPGFDMAPTWSGHNRIIFSSDRDGADKIWEMNLDEGESTATVLTDGPWDEAPDAYDPFVAWERLGNPTQIWVGSTAGKGKQKGQPDQDLEASARMLCSDCRNPRFSPDGKSIAFFSDGHIWVKPTVGNGPARQLTFGEFEYLPAWDPDGEEIYYADLRASDIFKVPANGGDPVQVTPSEQSPNRHPALSRDGHWLAFTSRCCGRYGDIVLQNLQTGEHTLVSFDPSLAVAWTGSEFFQNLEFSPDGRRLMFTVVEGGNDINIYVADLSAYIE